MSIPQAENLSFQVELKSWEDEQLEACVFDLPHMRLRPGEREDKSTPCCNIHKDEHKKLQQTQRLIQFEWRLASVLNFFLSENNI